MNGNEFISEFKKNIFDIDDKSFENAALSLFKFQYNRVSVYKKFVDALGVNPESVSTLKEIPFLPVEFFKTHKIQIEEASIQAIFESSGTTNSETSKHYVSDLKFYYNIAQRHFENTFGKLENFVVLGLLPSYLERKNSSLVTMLSHFMDCSRQQDSGFYLDDFEKLKSVLKKLSESGKKAVLFGVTFALLDFSERYNLHLNESIIIIETGGMKGRKNEMIREQLHSILKNKIGGIISSEYGMTELLSQAYMVNGFFRTPSWMKILVREPNDPLSLKKRGRGLINVIDLANIESCAFLALQDIANLNDDGTFEVLGRSDNSDIRGCSLMVI